MQFAYLPAINRDCLVNRGFRPMHWMDPRLRGTSAHHPFALAAYPYWRRQPYTWEPGEFVFGDSGGYSQRSRGLRIDPQRAIQWQIKFCTVGVVLDTPLGKPGAERDFHECLAQTVAATKAALPIYLDAQEKGSPFRWWGVVHGRTKDECAAWYEAISRVYPFTEEGEGWACKPWPWNDPEAVATTLGMLREWGIRRAHFFGQSSRFTVETLLALGPTAGLELATCDSTTPLTNANNRTLFVPTHSGWTFIRRRGEHAVREYMRSCGCVSCGFLREDLGDNADRGVGYWTQRMKFHNVLVMLDHFERLHERYGLPGTTPRVKARVLAPANPVF